MTPEIVLQVARQGQPFPPDAVRRTLDVLARHHPAFFPASMAVAPRRAVPVASPGDFDPAQVPAAFHIGGPRAVRVPLDGADGAELAVTVDQDAVLPSAAVLSWEGRRPPPLPVLRALLDGLVAALDASSGWVADLDTFLTPEVGARRVRLEALGVPPCIGWVNWIGPRGVAAVGADRLAALRAHVASVEPVHGGWRVTLQEEPYAEADPACAARRRGAEAALGLDTLAGSGGSGG